MRDQQPRLEAAAQTTSRLPYAGMTRIRFEGFLLTSLSARLGAHPQPINVYIKGAGDSQKLDFIDMRYCTMNS